jgi:hypothetical protein
MGGLFVRWYQHEHPDQVVGMVLVDTYETTAPVNGKQVPLYTLTKEQKNASPCHPEFPKHPPPTCSTSVNLCSSPPWSDQLHQLLSKHVPGEADGSGLCADAGDPPSLAPNRHARTQTSSLRERFLKLEPEVVSLKLGTQVVVSS